MIIRAFIFFTSFMLSCFASARSMPPYILTYDCSGPSKFQLQVPYPASLDMRGMPARPGFNFFGDYDPKGRNYSDVVSFTSSGKVRAKDNMEKADSWGGFNIWLNSIYKNGKAYVELSTELYVVTGKRNPRRECREEGLFHDLGDCDFLPTEAPNYGDTIFKNQKLDLSEPNFKIEINGQSFKCVGGPHNAKAIESASRRVQWTHATDGTAAASK